MSTPDFSHVTFISAGAGSGKTYRVTKDLERALLEEGVRPDAIIGTTFTVKAAGELRDRVRETLIASGRSDLAQRMAQALLGTVHSVCEKLLSRFAFELGLSPQLNVMSLEDGVRLFNHALDDALTPESVHAMNRVAARLEQSDWRADVRRVADKMRENAMPPERMDAMAEANASALTRFFPAEHPGTRRSALLAAVRNALNAVDTREDRTKTTAKYVDLLRGSAYRLARGQDTWQEWMRLANEQPGAKNRDVAVPVQECAGRYAAAAEFQSDAAFYAANVPRFAGLAVARFQALKTQQGLIDFLDMERLMLDGLDDPAVADTLRAEVELLVVDEFQDTNPMQLALFVKLARLVSRVIFVGDVKQAIYAFRGCDPDLVFATLGDMTRFRAGRDVLPSSWRSRPHLVQYANSLFTAAFAGKIPAEDVVLRPQRSEETAEPAVVHWQLASNRNDAAASIAEGIAQLVASGYRIVDRDDGRTRAVRWEDISVLARTNNQVERIARALKDHRVPMKMSLTGLLRVPEVCFARACLRRLNDPADTLATAEIMSLADCREPEEWLAERLQWLADGGDRYSWGEGTHPVVTRLAELRNDSVLRSPVEIVARVLNDVGARRIAATWGRDAIKAEQRQRNLDAFLELAVQYEAYCGLHHSAASLTGFLFWLDNPTSPELDLQPVVTSGDAVHVLTYHKAKGLEWPVVVAADFDVTQRDDLWDPRILLTAPFDVTDPLGHRELRFWPNLFGRRTRGVPLRDAIIASAEASACFRAGQAEARRLAYVGITRARDLLVVALPDKPVAEKAWLRTFDVSASAIPDGDELELGGERVPTAVRAYTGGGEPPHAGRYAPHWFAERERIATVPPAFVSPSSADPIAGGRIADVVEIGPRINLTGDDVTTLGNALHAVIAAEIVNPNARDASQAAAALLSAHGAADTIRVDDALEISRRFASAITERFAPVRTFAECPVAWRRADGVLIRGVIDLLLETDDGYVVVDHKSSPRPQSDWADEAAAYSGQLAAYRDAVASVTRRPVETWLHMAITGALIRVELPASEAGRR